MSLSPNKPLKLYVRRVQKGWSAAGDIVNKSIHQTHFINSILESNNTCQTDDINWKQETNIDRFSPEPLPALPLLPSSPSPIKHSTTPTKHDLIPTKKQSLARDIRTIDTSKLKKYAQKIRSNQAIKLSTSTLQTIASPTTTAASTQQTKASIDLQQRSSPLTATLRSQQKTLIHLDISSMTSKISQRIKFPAQSASETNVKNPPIFEELIEGKNCVKSKASSIPKDISLFNNTALASKVAAISPVRLSKVIKQQQLESSSTQAIQNKLKWQHPSIEITLPATIMQRTLRSKTGLISPQHHHHNNPLPKNSLGLSIEAVKINPLKTTTTEQMMKSSKIKPRPKSAQNAQRQSTSSSALSTNNEKIQKVNPQIVNRQHRTVSHTVPTYSILTESIEDLKQLNSNSHVKSDNQNTKITFQINSPISQLFNQLNRPLDMKDTTTTTHQQMQKSMNVSQSLLESASLIEKQSQILRTNFSSIQKNSNKPKLRSKSQEKSLDKIPVSFSLELPSQNRSQGFKGLRQRIRNPFQLKQNNKNTRCFEEDHLPETKLVSRSYDLSSGFPRQSSNISSSSDKFKKILFSKEQPIPFRTVPLLSHSNATQPEFSYPIHSPEPEEVPNYNGFSFFPTETEEIERKSFFDVKDNNSLSSIQQTLDLNQIAIEITAEKQTSSSFQQQQHSLKQSLTFQLSTSSKGFNLTRGSISGNDLDSLEFSDSFSFPSSLAESPKIRSIYKQERAQPSSNSSSDPLALPNASTSSPPIKQSGLRSILKKQQKQQTLLPASTKVFEQPKLETKHLELVDDGLDEIFGLNQNHLSTKSKSSRKLKSNLFIMSPSNTSSTQNNESLINFNKNNNPLTSAVSPKAFSFASPNNIRSDFMRKLISPTSTTMTTTIPRKLFG